MSIRKTFGLATLALSMMAATIVPAIAGQGGPVAPAVIPSTTQTSVIIDTGVIQSEDGSVAISALAVTLTGN